MDQHRFWQAALASLVCMIGSASLAHADWAACQSKPTRACILDEAFSKDGAPLAGKGRLDVLVAAGAVVHMEYVTPADIAEAQKAAHAAAKFTEMAYALIAIKGLVAAGEKQQAIDLVSTFTGTMQDVGIRELARSLVRADDVDTALALTERLQPSIDPKRVAQYRGTVEVETTKTLADEGKIDKALARLAKEPILAVSAFADMQIAVARAYAKRGDTNAARDYYDKAAKNLQQAIGLVKVSSGEMQLRYQAIMVMALRGDAPEAIKAALQQLSTAPPDPSTDYARSNGFRGVIAALVDTKQYRLAIEITQSLAQANAKDGLLAAISTAQATEGRLDEARATLALMADPANPSRPIALRTLAGATAKAGDVATALQIAGQIKDPMTRAAALFLVAQAMPK